MDLEIKEKINKKPSLFPTTRYQGSKRRLAPWLFSILSEVEFETVLDGFGGSASASYLFKLMKKEVHFNDVLQSSYQTGLALIENSDITLEENDYKYLLDMDEDASCPTFIEDNFENIYYYPDENRWLDQIAFRIRTWSIEATQEAIKYKQALAYHALFQACLSKRPFNLFHRKNLYLRDGDVERSFGNKKTWDTDFAVLFRKFGDEASSKIISNKKSNRASCGDLMQLDNIGYDLIYLDPPYQRPSETKPKDYFDLYHFMEGLIDYDNWGERIDVSRKHKPLKKISSDLDSKSPLERIRLIIERFQDSKIAISYGAPGIPTVDELKELLKEYKNTVNVYETEYSYKLNKKNGSSYREVLLVGE